MREASRPLAHGRAWAAAALGLAALLGLPRPARATERRVPSQYGSIKAAITAAVDGDTVLVADGTYPEYGIDFQGKAITVTSENGPANCIVDGQEMGSCFFFFSGEGPSSVLAGFTIQHGVSQAGGGIYCAGSSPTITDCILTENVTVDEGSGIYCYQSAAIIKNCIISGNAASGCG